MNQTEMAKNLKSLVQLDIDAIHAYTQAIEKIDIQSVKTRLNEFKNDHQRHVESLTPFVQRFGGEAPKFSLDFKGYLIEGFTALRSITGTEGALKAMRTNEMLTNKNYDKALAWDLPKDVRQIVERNREDERRHLQYIEQCIKQCVWEKRDMAA